MTSSGSIALTDLRSRAGLGRDYPHSFVAFDDVALWLERVQDEKKLAILAHPEAPLLSEFTCTHQTVISPYVLCFCPVDAENAATLRRALPWLRPTQLGLTTSAGFGDRLGLATPGHARALLDVLQGMPGRIIAPIFAQQSIREMTRTHRTPVDVLTDATWGAFEAGWHAALGADADHLKTTEDVDLTAAAGYSFFTIDPGEYVDDQANHAPVDTLQRKLDALPWQELETDPRDLQRRYAGTTVELEDRRISVGGESVARAAVKYGRAIAHVRTLYRHLADLGVPFELEVSVDETGTPTSQVEHLYMASELRRLGVRFISLAPRYVGRFEKGVDYVGDLAALRADLDLHAAIARALGPYKLSLHSGSDKLSVYPLAHAATRGLIHLKTAGTSYLEALRVTARIEPDLFREVVTFARRHYARDRATYHVSATIDRVPAPASVPDERLPDLLDDFDARQVLHVTFGSALDEFGDRLLDVLRTNESAYSEALELHFVRHLTPFVQPTQP